MKKKWLLLIFLFCVILNFKPEKVNAEYDYFSEGGLCVYEGTTVYVPGALHIDKISATYASLRSAFTSLAGADSNQTLVIKGNTKDDVFDITFRYNGMPTNPVNQNNMYYSITGQMTGFTAYDHHDVEEPSNGTVHNINITYTKQAKVELSSAGECPTKVFIKHAKTVTGKGNLIYEFKFIKNIKDFNVTDAIQGAIIRDNYVSMYYLKKSRFGNKEKYTKYSESTCMDDTDSVYYREMFKELEKYPNNYAYINIYKANKMDKIATSIISRYSEGSQCYNDFPGRRINYNDVVEHARKALEIMNKKSPTKKKYKNECEYILGSKTEKGSVAYYIDITFRFIKFLAPMLLIVLTIIDYVKIMASSDADLIKKTNNKTIIRLIFTLLLFLLPIIINTVLSFFGLQGEC